MACGGVTVVWAWCRPVPLGTFWYQQTGDEVPRSVMGELHDAVLDAQQQNR